MGFMISAPLVADGVGELTAAQSWLRASSTQPTEVVDADILARNFRGFYSLVNGGLQASNFNVWKHTAMARTIPEAKIQFPEFFSGPTENYNFPNRSAYQGHSHDGRDSSLLGAGAVNRTNTRLRPYGAFMYPSKSRVFWVFFGTTELALDIQDFNATATTQARTVVIEIPYNPHRLWPTWPYTPVWRAFVTPYCTVRGLMDKITVHKALVEWSTTTPADYFLTVNLRLEKPGSYVGSMAGIGLNWLVTCQSALMA